MHSDPDPYHAPTARSAPPTGAAPDPYRVPIRNGLIAACTSSVVILGMVAWQAAHLASGMFRVQTLAQLALKAILIAGLGFIMHATRSRVCAILLTLLSLMPLARMFLFRFDVITVVLLVLFGTVYLLAVRATFAFHARRARG
jgi:hypothetical protein